MKKKYSAKWLFVMLFAVTGITALSSCSKDDDHHPKDYYDKVLNLPVATVKELYKGEDIQLNKDKDFEQINISGVVISDAAAANLPMGLLVVQQDDAGIGIKLKDSAAATSFHPGDNVKINIASGTLTKEDGNVVIEGIASSDITPSQAGKKVAPNKITLKTLFNNFDKYNGSLVQIYIAEIVPKPAAGDTYAGSKGLSDGSGDPGAIQLYTFPGSDLAHVPISDNATYTGIAMYGSGGDHPDSLVKQIWLRNKADITTSEIIPIKTPIIITGFLANPRGSDEKVKGDETDYSDGTVIIHKGGYEYIQLMALKDIDFSKTPYSIVTCNNASAKAGGWAEGGSSSYKFDLTEGFAAAGTFFYVGAAAKVICAYWPDGLSTDISGANWIRSIQVYVGDVDVVTGDGFGTSINSFLGNSNSSDGIAVFDGTNVTSSSVPLDAVFFNPPVGSALKGSYGYEVPDNDLYSRKDPKTGAAQPLFGEGTNTFAVADAGEDNHFAIMGGIVTADGWLVKRDPSTITLSMTSQLSDIQSGPGITVFRKN